MKVWCDKVAGFPWEFVAARGAAFVAISARTGEVSYYSGRGDPDKGLLQAAQQYRLAYRECLNT